MTAAVVQFAVAALVVIVAGAALTTFADALADLTKMGRLLVGSILLAGATSLPELTVDLNAVRLGLPDLAVGDLVGSCLFNLLILAVADLAHHARGQMLSRTAAAHALSGSTCIALSALVAVCILISPRWPQLTFGGFGVGTLAIGVTYVFAARMVFYDQRISAKQAESEGQDIHAAARRLTLTQAIAGFVISAAVIVLTGPYMAESAGKIAELSGLGNTFMGSTLVAFSTSLPELVATLTAVRIGAFDLAIGNIYGSNAFNMVLLVPLDAVAPGSLLAGVSQTHAVTCLCTVLITCVTLMGQLYLVERRMHILEPDAWLVILLVFASLGLLYLLR